MNLQVEYMPIGKLLPYAGNAKEHPDWQIEQIEESIETFGFCDPVGVVTNPDGTLTIMEGHGRVLAESKRGSQVVPVIRLDHLTDEQRIAYPLVHNRLTMNTGFDLQTLSDELAKIETLDMAALGFDSMEDELAKIRNAEIEFEESEVPENPPTRCKPGDRWILGDHVLVCGDSTKAATYEKLMQGGLVDLLLTDPPYNVALGHHMRPSEAKQLHRRTDGLVIDNDSWQSDEDFQEFLVKAFRNSIDNMREGAAFYIWYASNQSGNFFVGAKDAGLEIRQVIVWNKSVFALGRQDYQWKHELCLYGWKDGAAHYFVNDRTLPTVWSEPEPDIAHMAKGELVEMVKSFREWLDGETTVWDFDKPNRSAEHPTMKPVDRMGRSILNSTKPGEAVLDPFGGSGSTLMACEQSGRRCYTIELDPHYCDVIPERWERETGREAVLNEQK